MLNAIKNSIKKLPFLSGLFRQRDALFLQNSALRRENGKLKFKLSLQNAHPPHKIILGASGICQKGWLATEKNIIDAADRNDWKLFFAENSIEALLAEHVWEHLTPEDALLATQNCHDFLKPGGVFRIAVPDGFNPNTNYINNVNAGKDGHKVLYNYKTMGGILQKAGFKIKLLEYWNEKGEFKHTDWNPEDGMINRSRRFDCRNKNGTIAYTSLIIDAVKT